MFKPSTKTILIGIAALSALIYATRKGTNMLAASDATNKNVQAFLALIKKFESKGGDYSIIYGGTHFTDFASHPNVRIPFFDKRTNSTNYSTAAGAYQITVGTWRMINATMHLSDFSPKSQDLAAIWLLNYCGAMPLILKGDITGALQKASTQWASLPYTTSLQNHVSLDSAVAAYKASGGTMTA